jgi:hypothetical protein
MKVTTEVRQAIEQKRSRWQGLRILRIDSGDSVLGHRTVVTGAELTAA